MLYIQIHDDSITPSILQDISHSIDVDDNATDDEIVKQVHEGTAELLASWERIKRDPEGAEELAYC